MAVFCERLRYALHKRNMKPSMLAYKTNISNASLSHYLKGHYIPKNEKMSKIAKALNVSDAWLMGYDVPMERETTSLEELKFSEGEKKWLELYYRLSGETKKVFIDMMDSFDELSADTQRFLLDAIRIAFGNQK